MTNVDVWSDTCGSCGCDLPLDAPSYQKYCSPQCRETAYEGRMLALRQERCAMRRKARLSVKCDHPCEECGKVIPAEANYGKRFCSDPCQRRNYDRRKAAARREERLEARAKARAERRATGDGRRANAEPRILWLWQNVCETSKSRLSN